MPRIPYSFSRMLCHIAIGFIGGMLFLGGTGSSHPDQAGTSLHAELLRFLSSGPLAKP